MISPYTELLMGLRCAVKLHERSLDAIQRQYGLTRMETDILAFLVNNPGKDTAADMVALRGFQRGNVSQGVEALIQKGLLNRRQDTRDRRKIHLFLTPEAEPVREAAVNARECFNRQLFQGLSVQERETYIRLTSQILKNAKQGLEEENESWNKTKIS